MFENSILFFSEILNDIQGSNNVFQNSDNNSNAINNVGYIGMTEQEREILRIYNTLSVKEKAYMFLDICKYEK